MSTLLFVAIALCGHAARADETATLRGRFVYQGDPPRESPELVVDRQTRGIANVLVFKLRQRNEPVQRVEGTVNLILDEAGFDRRLVGLMIGQTLRVKYQGDEPHATTDPRPLRQAVSPTLKPVLEHTYEFDRAWPFAYPITCHVHEDERAWVFAHSSPHYVITEPDGVFVLEDLPPGEHVSLLA